MLHLKLPLEKENVYIDAHDCFCKTTKQGYHVAKVYYWDVEDYRPYRGTFASLLGFKCFLLFISSTAFDISPFLSDFALCCNILFHFFYNRNLVRVYT